MLTGMREFEAAKEVDRTAEEAWQNRASDARVAHAAQLVTDERDAYQRPLSTAFRRHKEALRRAAKLQKEDSGAPRKYTPVPGAVDVPEPARKRAHRSKAELLT